jgi:hypothetical protein
MNKMTDAFLWRNIVGAPGFIYIFEFKLDGAVRKCLVSDKEKGRILKVETGLLVLGI